MRSDHFTGMAPGESLTVPNQHLKPVELDIPWLVLGRDFGGHFLLHLHRYCLCLFRVHLGPFR